MLAIKTPAKTYFFNSYAVEVNSADMLFLSAKCHSFCKQESACETTVSSTTLPIANICAK